MSDFSFLSDENFIGFIFFSTALCLFSWFLGYAIRLVISLLYKIINNV